MTELALFKTVAGLSDIEYLAGFLRVLFF